MTLATVSAQAAPLPPAKSPAAELGAGPPIELVAQGVTPTGIGTIGATAGAIGTGAGASRIGDPVAHAAGMPDLANDPEYRLTLRQADQAREDFAAIRDELDFVKGQLSRVPTRAWLSRMAFIGFGGVWALLAGVLLMLAG